MKKTKSLVVGYCICKNCGWSNNKFNWHTYFKCPECGSIEYVKPDLWGEYKDEPKPEEEFDDSDLLAVSGGCRDCDLSWLRK